MAAPNTLTHIQVQGHARRASGGLVREVGLSVHRILVVDNDETNAKVLRYLLKDEGYDVETVDSAEAAEMFLEQEHVDLILAESNLAGMDGLELCRRVRNRYKVPFIFLTHKILLKDKLAGFNAGGDDYIVKPYEPAEVLVRVWALLRRDIALANNETTLRTNDLILESVSGQVILTRNNAVVMLTAKEAILLHYLVSNPGRTLTRDALMIRVWGYQYDSSNNQLDVYISRLRNRIEERPSAPQINSDGAWHRVSFSAE